MGMWVPFDIDMFASRLSFKIPNYVSWKPKPGASFTVLLHLLVGNPRLLPQSKTLLVQPHSNVLHCLKKEMQLIACRVSGKVSSREVFQTKLQKLFCARGPIVNKQYET